MRPRLFALRSFSSSANSYKAFVTLCLAFVSVLPVQARNTSLQAIEFYNGPSGLSYLHITDVLINGKAELRACGSEKQIDRSLYGKLEKVGLAAGATLEYGTDGTLTLTSDGQTSCVVPSNVKFEKSVALTRVELAERAVLEGKVLGPPPGASDVVPPLQPGVRIVFVPEPDVELAEYLRAGWASTVSAWQDYLSRYPSASHTAAAKKALCLLLVKDGEQGLDAYRKTITASSPSYADLKSATVRLSQALALDADNRSAMHLKTGVSQELAALTGTAKDEIDAYRLALMARKTGYSHLLSARKLADAAVSADSSYAPAVNVQGDVNQESRKIESYLQSAEALAVSQAFDSAFWGISDYLMFASEEPRLAAIVTATYRFHFEKGQAFAAAHNWKAAVAEFQQAAKIENTEEAAAALKIGERELEAERNKSAAADALQQSQSFAEQRQFIQAYDALDNLPVAQRSLVADEIQKLTPQYIQSALQTAKELQHAHDPISGLADEIAIQRAYEYYQRAYELNEDAILRDRMATLADKLSDYYLAQAKRYLNKPLGSGVGLGWSFLNKALPYKAANLDAIRDEMTKAASVYQVRSKLSIRVAFRDQTSRRDSGGFADQLADAIATGLESGGLFVKVIRPTDSAALDPNFQLIGDVLQHRRVLQPTIEPKESKYRVGTHEAPNEQWNKANRAYEAALLELQSAQKGLDTAQGRGKKKEIADANQLMSNLRKKVEDARSALDSLNKTIPVDIVQPYTYTRKTIDLGAVVQLQFRIADFSGTQVVSTVPILRDVHQQFTLLESVKPEDTEGVKAQGSLPDEIQVLTDVEIEARDKLIKAACEKVAELPTRVLENARKRISEGDAEGAAESYILYLNSTAASQNTQRKEAESFLKDQFNIRSSPKSSI